MASRPTNKAIGGVTPLGVFTITPGTPQKLTSLMALSDKVYTFSCQQIGFSVESSPSGQIFVNYGNFNGAGGGVADPNATALIIQSGQQQALPIGASASGGLIDASAWWIDGSAACLVAVYALDASS